MTGDATSQPSDQPTSEGSGAAAPPPPVDANITPVTAPNDEPEFPSAAAEDPQPAATSASGHDDGAPRVEQPVAPAGVGGARPTPADPATAPDAPSAAPGGPTAGSPGQLAAGAVPALRAVVNDLIQPRGIVTAALSLAVVLGVALVAAITIMIALSTSIPAGSSTSDAIPGVGGGADVGTALGAIFLLACALLGGGLGVSMRGSGSLFGMDPTELGAGASISIIAIGVLAAAAVGVYLVVRVRERAAVGAAPGAIAIRSAAEALAVALIVTIIAAVARLSVGGGSSEMSAEIVIQAHVFGAFLGAFVAVFLGAAGARWMRRTNRLPSTAARHTREVVSYLALSHAFTLVVALVMAIVLAVRADSPGLALLWLPFGANLAALLFGAAQFGGVTVGVAGSLGAQNMRLWDVMGGWSAVVFVAMVLVLAVIAVRIGVRRTRSAQIVWQRVWVLPAILLAGSVLAALTILPVSAAGEVPIFGAMRVAVGPSWETPLLIALFAAAVSIGAEVLPRVLYTLSPALLATLGGRRATADWLAGVSTDVAPASPVVATPTTVPTAPGVDATPATDGADAAMAGLFAPATTVADDSVTATAPTQPPASEAVADAQPVAGTVPPLPERKPLSPSAKRGLIAALVSVGAVALLITGAVVAVSVLNAQRDPAAQARAYLDAIANGDATAASKIIDPGLRTAERALLVDEAFAEDTQRIEVVEVTTTQRSGTGASISATYRLDGEVFEADFSAVPGPKDFLVLDTWKLTGSPLIFPVNVQTTAAVPEVEIGGVAVPTAKDDARVTLYAYPALYPVKIGGGSEWYEAKGTNEVRVIPGENAFIEGEVVETKALQDAVLKTVTDRVKKCVEVPTNMDAMCPYSVRQTDLDKLSVVESPDGFDFFSDGRFQTTGGTVSTTRSPSAFDSKPSARESSFTMNGTYEITDGKVVVDFSDGW